jgi:hypothetical protein
VAAAGTATGSGDEADAAVAGVEPPEFAVSAGALEEAAVVATAGAAAASEAAAVAGAEEVERVVSAILGRLWENLCNHKNKKQSH